MEGCETEEQKVKVGICWQLSDGRYLSGKDADFIEQILEDIQSFSEKSIRDSVLVFPPFKNFHRFLIHNLVEENFKGLKTFSVGQSLSRRTVVCHKDAIIKSRPSEEDAEASGGGMGVEQRCQPPHEAPTAAHPGRKKARMLPDVAIYRPPPLRSQGITPPAEGMVASAADRNPKQSKQRRPDIAVYVPRALRAVAKDMPADTVCSAPDGPQAPAASPRHDVVPSSGTEAPGGSSTTGANEHGAGGGGHGDLAAAATGGVSSEVSSAVGHWEDRLLLAGDDSGSALGSELLEEVSAAVGRVSVVERPRVDYGAWRSDTALDELAHVVEVFGFPAEFKTHDLISILSGYGGRGSGFEIKWVDDTHALAVFGSAFVAADVLSLRHPMLKTCALAEASAASKAKARKLCDSLKVPYRPRPETCAALAQRLITGALGVQHRQSKAEREEERRLLREAREKRRSAARERDAAWEGTIGTLH